MDDDSVSNAIAEQLARLEPYLRAMDVERDIPVVGDRLIELLDLGSALPIYHVQALAALLDYLQGRLEIDLMLPTDE